MGHLFCRCRKNREAKLPVTERDAAADHFMTSSLHYFQYAGTRNSQGSLVYLMKMHHLPSTQEGQVVGAGVGCRRQLLHD